jgi:predicted aspartyl protease
MLPTTLVVLFAQALSIATIRPFPFEIASNKPFVQVTVNGSVPQWFILDTGNNGNSIVAKECADRLALKRSAEQKRSIGAGSGTDVGISNTKQSVHLQALGETLTVAEPLVVPLGHVARLEGRPVDGLLGADYLAGHVVEIDYARNQITVRDTAGFAAPAGAIVVPLNLETGWPVVEGTVSIRGGNPVRCRLIVDTGVRFTLALFRPFCEKHGLYGAAGNLHNAVIGGGMGGVSRGDVTRLDALTLGPAAFPQPVAIFSRDTSGVFTLDGPEGIVGGELLRRHRATFDYAHRRLILEPYASPPPFEYDMSGLFLAAEAPDFRRITIMGVQEGTPAADAGLQSDDEIASIDGQRAPKLTLDGARALLRTSGARQLEIRRAGKLLRVRLEARRLV